MFDEKETFNGEKQIAEMLSSLNRVDAPSDFNTHVRSRIARGASVPANSWAVNLVRVGAFAAVAVAVAVGGYFALNSINTGQNGVPIVAEVLPTPTPIAEQPASNSDTGESSSRTDVKPSDELVAQNDAPTNAKPNGPNSTEDRPIGGSKDLAVRESIKIYPRGVNPNAKPPSNATGVDPNVRINVSQILEFIGVKATWAVDGWRVDSVEANNIGGRSGLKTGDVVQAINGQTVDKKTTFPAKFDGKSIRVRRDGASVQIDFKP